MGIFTLIKICIAIALIGVVLTIAGPLFALLVNFIIPLILG